MRPCWFRPGTSFRVSMAATIRPAGEFVKPSAYPTCETEAFVSRFEISARMRKTPLRGREHSPRSANTARDRNALLGVRELRYAVPCVSVARRRTNGRGADRGRGARASTDRLLPERRH